MSEIISSQNIDVYMRTKTALLIVTLFLMQSYAMNLSNPTMPDELNETTEYTYEVGARSSSGMLAIPDGTQENMLDNQSYNGDNDNDGDGVSDANDPDDDNDCVPDTWDTSPRDFDGDGIRDHEDIDDDGDGLNDSDEVTDSDSMTNIYDSDNDGYHDCSSFGMYLFDMLDVEVEKVPTMDGNDVIRWDGEFTINASNLVIGETYGISWWLLNADAGYIINSSTANTFTAQSDFQVMYGTWYGMENATYYITAELWYANGSNTSHYHLASGDDAFTIAQTTDFGNSDCNPIALLSNRNVVTGSNQTEFIFGVDEIDLYAYHPCLVGGMYEWNFSISGPNGYIANEWTEGTFFVAQGPDDYDLNVKSYLSQFNPGDYTWTYGLRNSTQNISEWFTHNFTVVDDSGNQDNIHPNCANEYMFESIEADVAGRLDISMVSNSISDPEYSGNDIIETNFDLCWTPTNESISMIAWLNATDAPYNGPTQGGEQIDRIVYSGFDINHQGHKSFHASHTYSQINAWDYTAAELDSGWYCWEGWLKVYDAEGGLGFVLTDLILWDATCFEVVEEEPSDNETNLLGYCSFPTFEATPTELYSGDDLTFTWTMDGDVSDQVYLALVSGWGAQYYFSSIEDNDGSHTITLPANMNPNADYTIYIESAYDDNRTTLCWKYGSIDILEEDEDIIIDDIIDLFLNSTDERPRISMWYGKVNQHNEDGTWMTDPDGVAGAGLHSQWGSEGWGDRKLEYCQRFWPDTVEIRTSAPEEIVFYTRGNTDAYLTMKPVWLCVQDTDGDGILDPEDQDDDNDGWADIIEEACLSDALDANVVPADLDGDGLCDVLQILLIDDYEPAEPGFCTNGEITGGNGLLGQTEFTEVVLIEMTGGNHQYQYEIQDTSSNLYSDIAQQPSNFDFIGYYEYYDVFVSNANGEFDMNGSFITIQARSDLSTSNLGVGHNIDSIGLRDANGNVIYATEVVAVELGDGLGSNNPAGRQDKILGPADQIPTALGNNEASITVSFCPIDIASDDESVPGFGVMGALVALGAAMFAGRRALTEDDE